MKYAEATKRLQGFREQIGAIRQEMREVQAAIEPQEVEDYSFSTTDGKRRLSELFGDKDDLIVIHNMGRACMYCTLWADGFNGIREHLENRAAFVVATPDSPDVQQEFAKSRNWGFRMVSHEGTNFAADMGYRDQNGGWMPGISIFKRDGDRIIRVSDTEMGPGDDFCALWHILDLLPEGPDGWQPKYKYA